MKGRHIVLAVLLLLVLGAAFLVWRAEQNSKAWWDNWVDEQTETAVNNAIGSFARNNPDAEPMNDAQVADIRHQLRAKFEKRAEVQRRNSSLFSRTKAIQPSAQTVAALMEAFDVEYDMKNEFARGSFSVGDENGEFRQKVSWTQAELDAKYPRAEWIQMLLDKGITIDNFDDYNAYLNVRTALFRAEHSYDAADWETARTAFIDSQIQQYQRVREAKRANPDVERWTTIGENVHPSASGKMYVQRAETGAHIVHMSRSVTRTSENKVASVQGTQLSEKQRFNLLYRGVEPEGWEVVYVDEKGNILSDAPLPSRKAVREKMGIEPAPTPTAEPVPFDDAAIEMPELLELSAQPTSEPADDAPTRVQEAARAAQEEFERAQEQQREWATLSDEEIEAELEKRLTPGIPELPTDESIEAELRGQLEPEANYRTRLAQLEPERLQRAMDTLNRYGPKEGLRRLKIDDAETAELIERSLGGKSSERPEE